MAVGAVYAVQGFGFALMVTSFPAMKARYDLSDTLVSILLLSLALTAAGGSVLANAISVRRNSRMAVLVGLALQILGLATIGAGLPVEAYVVGVVIYGVGLGAIDASSAMQGVLAQRGRERTLLGRYFAAAHDQTGAARIAAPPDAQRIETALSFDWLTEWEAPPTPPLAARPSTMEWVGTVRLAETGGAALRLTTTADARLYLDGRLVVDAAGGGYPAQRVEAEVDLPAAPVDLLLRVVRRADDPFPWVLALEWREAGGDWSAFAHYRPPADAAE